MIYLYTSGMWGLNSELKKLVICLKQIVLNLFNFITAKINTV